MKFGLATLALLVTVASCSELVLRQQDEGRIFTEAQDSVNGSFTYPRQWPLRFREGSVTNITWKTSYKNVNLFFYQRGKVANSVMLGTNLATNWYQWEMKAKETNLTNPFVFRVVNSVGTSEEQTQGGFWSTSWYLARDEAETSSVKSSASSTASATSAASATAASVSPSITQSLGEPVSSGTASRTGAGSSSTGAAGTTQTEQNSGLSTGAIAGLAVGLVVAAAAVIAGVIFFLRRRKDSKATPPYTAELAAPQYSDKTYYAHHAPPQQPVHEAEVRPYELHSQAPVHELPGHR